MSVTSVKFRMTIHSGNQAVVDDPEGTLRACFESVTRALPHLLGGADHEWRDIELRDANGNSIGYVYALLERVEGAE